MSFWKVSDFKKVNEPWGNYRRLIGKIEIADGQAFIGLFRENDNGDLHINVHRKDGRMITAIGGFKVDNTRESKQMALDKLFDNLLAL